MICKESDNRGLAGVAALIVFIALVLVAAIAAAVILDVGGVLEQQAGETGMEASDQLSSQLNVLSTIGHIGENGEDVIVDEIDMTVAASPGADDLNLQDVTIEIVSPSGAATLTAVDEEDDDPVADEDDPQFAIDEITSESEFALVTSPEDRHQLTLGFEDGEGALDELEEGENVEITVVTGPGGQTFESFSVPTTLSDNDETISL